MGVAAIPSAPPVTRQMLRCSCSHLHKSGSLAAANQNQGGAQPSTRPARTALFVSSAASRKGASELQNDKPVTAAGRSSMESIVSSHSALPTDLGRQLRLRSVPEVGLVCLLFVLSTAVGAIISLALISIPTVSAFKRLAISVDKLVQLVSVEVPGSLSSLRLFCREINDLVQQLSNLR